MCCDGLLQALHSKGEEGRGPARLQAARELADLLDSASQHLSEAPGEYASESALLQKVCHSSSRIPLLISNRQMVRMMSPCTQPGLTSLLASGDQCVPLLACQVVLGGMAQRLASWVLRDGSLLAADAVQSQLLSTSVALLPPVNHAHQMHIGACALGKVMV